MTAAATDIPGLLRYAHQLLSAGERHEALAAARRAAALPVERSDWSDALGTLFTYCEEPSLALPFFQRAVTLSPNNTAYLYNLATAQRMRGDLLAADETLNRVIATQPAHAAAHYLRADLRTQNVANNHIEPMIRALESGMKAAHDRIMLCFAIAKEADDIGQFDLAFQYLQRGCDQQRRLFTYDVQADLATLDRIIRLHTRTTLSPANGPDTRECIFVMGLPRTGTTLLEQILSSHPEVYGAGELPTFPALTIKAVQQLAGRQVAKQDFVALSLQVDAAALGRSYLEAVRPQTGGARCFVDKLPTNYLYAGLVQRALPGARLIAITRDPTDSCFAMYRTLFPGTYPFSYTFPELASYYAAWNRLIRHWQIALAESLLVVSYEDLVRAPEPTIRRLLAHCGLTWNDACLSFHSQARAVTTASAVQVRRPLYSSSVGKWRPYASQLQPLLDCLAQLEPSTGWSLPHRLPV
jgi:tetratricopeptide (TPR) repeat protein